MRDHADSMTQSVNSLWCGGQITPMNGGIGLRRRGLPGVELMQAMHQGQEGTGAADTEVTVHDDRLG